MANPENLRGKGNRFSSTNQPANRGRKPSILKGLIKKYDLSKSDVDAIIQNLLFDHTVGELEKIAGDKKQRNALPAFAAYFMNLIEISTSKGDSRALAYFLDRLHGKPKENIDFRGNMDIGPDTLEKLNAIFHENSDNKKPRKNSRKKPGDSK
jgi:hypothetical protein